MADKDIHKLFAYMAKYNASDLHLKASSKPLMRVSGTVREIDGPVLRQRDVKRLVYDILTPAQIQTFESANDLDLAYSLSGVGRFRINVFRQRGSVSVAARRVNHAIPSFAALNLPQSMPRLAAFPQGLVLVCGVTGSGKSTTLAAMIEHINETRHCHILTIEDPIEYLYRDKKAFINQREVGLDVADFSQALKYVVRQDPDVILIGEMRDPETFNTGLTAAETGHLVFGTLHSGTVAQTLGRILDMFPPDRESLIRHALAFNLKAIVCQKLLPSIAQSVDRVPAVEILLSTPIVQKLIREGEDEKILDAIRAGAEAGMQDFTHSLVGLVHRDLISRKVALMHAPNPDQLKMNLQGIYLGDKRILG